MSRRCAFPLFMLFLASLVVTGAGCGGVRTAETAETRDIKATVVDATTTTNAGDASTTDKQLPPVDFAQETWSPAEKLDFALEQKFADALQSAGIVALFPSEPPPLEGETTGQFSIDQRVGASAEALVVVRLPTVNPVVGVFSHGSGGPNLTEGTGAKPIMVRGQDGRWAPLSPDGVVVEWNEFGRRFFAEADGLDLAVLVSWLDTWRPIPAPTGE